MKDAIHHLKHVQKKVIQFARKADNPDYSPIVSSLKFLEEAEPTSRRKRRLFNQLPQVARFQ